MQKSMAFLHTNNYLEKKLTKPLTITSKRKYLGINLTKEVKDLYNDPVRY